MIPHAKKHTSNGNQIIMQKSSVSNFFNFTYHGSTQELISRTSTRLLKKNLYISTNLEKGRHNARSTYYLWTQMDRREQNQNDLNIHGEPVDQLSAM